MERRGRIHFSVASELQLDAAMGRYNLQAERRSARKRKNVALAMWQRSFGEVVDRAWGPVLWAPLILHFRVHDSRVRQPADWKEYGGVWQLQLPGPLGQKPQLGKDSRFLLDRCCVAGCTLEEKVCGLYDNELCFEYIIDHSNGDL
jgi:hypothetical protein